MSRVVLTLEWPQALRDDLVEWLDAESAESAAGADEDDQDADGEDAAAALEPMCCREGIG